MDTRYGRWMWGLVAVVFVLGMACDRGDDDDDTEPSTCAPTCWQHSPEQATGSTDQVAQWAAACEQAESGCDDAVCVATYLEFLDAPADLRYAVQCESNANPDRYDDCIGQEGMVLYLWLGEEYGLLADSNCIACGKPANRAPTGWAILAGEPNQWAGKFPWDEAKIADSLAHEISDVPCEQITDYRQCVRAFIPPYTHCVPDPYSLTDGTVTCEAAEEPFDREAGWRQVVEECSEE